uniref:Uncharacterized protein n=1 Tax=Plectus sambesii TaxID=2011161 RepID=A0A914V539_9BILA
MHKVAWICLFIYFICWLLVDSATAAPTTTLPPVPANAPQVDIPAMQKAAFLETFMKYLCMMNPKDCKTRKVEVPAGHLYNMNVILGSKTS